MRPGTDGAFARAVAQYAAQCDADDLSLNAKKTKELVVDFRKSADVLPPIMIKNEPIERVSEYKYLGTVVQEDLKWTQHITSQVKKATKRLYHLCKLREFRVEKRIQKLFYSSVIESVLLFGVTVWGGGCSQADAVKIRRIQRSAMRIIGIDLEPWLSVCEKRTTKKARRIIADTSHPLNHLYITMPSRRRPKLRQVKIRTNRFKQTFVPFSITLLNASQP